MTTLEGVSLHDPLHWLTDETATPSVASQYESMKAYTKQLIDIEISEQFAEIHCWGQKNGGGEIGKEMTTDSVRSKVHEAYEQRISKIARDKIQYALNKVDENDRKAIFAIIDSPEKATTSSDSSDLEKRLSIVLKQALKHTYPTDTTYALHKSLARSYLKVIKDLPINIEYAIALQESDIEMHIIAGKAALNFYKNGCPDPSSLMQEFLASFPALIAAAKEQVDKCTAHCSEYPPAISQLSTPYIKITDTYSVKRSGEDTRRAVAEILFRYARQQDSKASENLDKLTKIEVQLKKLMNPSQVASVEAQEAVVEV